MRPDLIDQIQAGREVDRSYRASGYERGAVSGPDEEIVKGDGQPTMTTIGRAAGVSRQTVWNVLHSPDRVREETRSRVERAIQEHRYRPNRVARSLRTRTARLLGYCVMPRAVGEINAVLHG